jgi:hypothetical protein
MGGLRSNASPRPKIIRTTAKAKRVGNMAEVAEHLHSKCRVLSSKPSSAKKEKKRNKENSKCM